ncbi:hypothetical protein L7F22_068196 [Adiantum nelumboides]|nr:hypothetical protein [Adiantum nelumboides]
MSANIKKQNGTKSKVKNDQISDTLTPAWRQLPFYDVSPVRDSSDFARSPAVFRTPSTIASIAQSSIVPAFTRSNVRVNAVVDQGNARVPSKKESKRQNEVGSILIGTQSGTVIACDPENYNILGSWTAFRGTSKNDKEALLSGRVTHILCDDKGRAITLGEDESVRFPILRIWDLNISLRSTDGTQSPRLLAEAKVQHGSKPFPVAAIAHTPSSSFIAIGLADGTVLLLRNVSEILENAPKIKSQSEGINTPAVILPKFKVVHQTSISKSGEAIGMDSVTGLGFSEHHPAAAVHLDQSSNVQAVGPTPRISKQRKRLDTNNFVAAEPDSSEAIANRQSGTTVHLFIATLSKILRYTVLGKGAGSPASSVDDVGCGLECAVMVPGNVGEWNGTGVEKERLAGKMVVARDEAIYVIGAEGREMSLAFEGKKSSIRLSSTQLIIISPPMPATAASASPTVRHYVAERDKSSSNFSKSNDVSKVTIFDLDSKLVAHSSTLEGGIRDAWSGPEGEICVLGDDCSVTRLDEKSLRQKLDILLRKSLYLLAISVAQSHAARNRKKNGTLALTEQSNVGPLLGDIHRKYGDYLYEKGDFEGAIGQFVKSIGVTQPSYVIRKFLDAQRITNLTTYLQELHARGFANADHTTLLLNCFAKLKDVNSLDKFIKRPIEKDGEKRNRSGEDLEESDDEGGDEEGGVERLPFDLDTAIRVCRQAGYFQHAAYLAQRYHQPDEYIRIQIEDVGNYLDAMRYVRSLPLPDAQRNLYRYGRRMLDHDAEATTDLLIELCSGAFHPVPIAEGSGIDASKAENKNYLTYLKVGRLGNAGGGKPVKDTVTKEDKEEEEKVQENAISSLPPPSPRPFFAHFLNHRAQFIRFLETVALARWDEAIDLNAINKSNGVSDPIEIDVEDELEEDEKRDQKTIWNTLLELYLSSYKQQNGKNEEGSVQTQRKRALALLHQYDSIPYDIGHAIVLCTQHDFDEGLVYLYERLGMYEDILRLHMERDDDGSEVGTGDKILETLKRYGSIEPTLYPLVLRHLVSDEKRLERHKFDVEKILTHVFEEGLLSPLEMVQLLSKKGVASVGLLRDHLMRALDAQRNDINTNAKLTQTYREETREKQEDIDALQNLDQPRIFQQSKCSSCGGNLDLPSVHFMCKHSFHSRCLGEGENECPLCAQSHGVILEIRKNNIQFGQRHDLFINEVEEAEDGFDVVASMFSKGLFGAQQLGQSQQ